MLDVERLGEALVSLSLPKKISQRDVKKSLGARELFVRGVKVGKLDYRRSGAAGSRWEISSATPRASS